MQSGWVIERDESPGSAPEYYTGNMTRARLWSDPGDHAAALRFARRQDAAHVAKQLSPFANKHRVCEHAWVDEPQITDSDRPTIVAEVSKNWSIDQNDKKPLISVQFEYIIEVNRQRGYALKEWRAHAVVDPMARLISETIIAVFERKGA